MGQRIYFRHRRIGVGVRTVNTRIQRQGLGVFQGNDQGGVKLSGESPNFLHEHTVQVSVWGVGWTQEELHEYLDDLATGLVDDCSNHGSGPLVWVKDDSHQTTTSNAESAGTGVVVEVASLSALGLAVNDYVLLLDAANDVAFYAKVTATATGPDSITVDLDDDLASGSEVWKGWMVYPSCYFDSLDPGAAPEQAMDHLRPITTWRFLSGTKKVRSAAS